MFGGTNMNRDISDLQRRVPDVLVSALCFYSALFLLLYGRQMHFPVNFQLLLPCIAYQEPWQEGHDGHTKSYSSSAIIEIALLSC